MNVHFKSCQDNTHKSFTLLINKLINEWKLENRKKSTMAASEALKIFPQWSILPCSRLWTVTLFELHSSPVGWHGQYSATISEAQSSDALQITFGLLNPSSSGNCYCIKKKKVAGERGFIIRTLPAVTSIPTKVLVVWMELPNIYCALSITLMQPHTSPSSYCIQVSHIKTILYLANKTSIIQISSIKIYFPHDLIYVSAI